MLQLKRVLTNQRPPSAGNQINELICKNPSGKIQLTQKAIADCGVLVGSRIIVEEFQGDEGSVFAIRVSDSEKGSIIDKKGLFSAGNAWVALGGVVIKKDGEVITQDTYDSLEKDVQDTCTHTQTVYTVGEATEAEIEEGTVVIVYPLEYKEAREFTPRVFSKGEDEDDENENEGNEEVVASSKKGKKAVFTEDDQN